MGVVTAIAGAALGVGQQTAKALQGLNLPAAAQLTASAAGSPVVGGVKSMIMRGGFGVAETGKWAANIGLASGDKARMALFNQAGGGGGVMMPGGVMKKGAA